MLMGHPSVQEAGSFKQCLDLFGIALGCEVNDKKSQVFFFNTPRVTQKNIGWILRFKESSLLSKYLGTRLINSVAKKGSWTDLLDSMKKHLENWTLTPLNLPSRLVLGNSVLQAMSTYLFSSMLATKSIMKDLRNMQRNFLWSEPRNHRNGLWLNGTLYASLNCRVGWGSVTLKKIA